VTTPVANRSATVLIANPGAGLYGSDRVLLESVQALRATGHRVVATVPEDGPLVADLTAAGAEVVICPTPVISKAALRPRGLARLLATMIRSLRPASRLIRQVDPDIVYVNTITPPLWLVLARVHRRHSICHVHEAEASASPVIVRALCLPLLLADRLVVNSEFSLGVLTRAIPRLGRRAQVVYNAVPGPPAITPPRAELRDPIQLLYVGRLSARKGPDVAIAALALLRNRGHDVRLDLVGAVFPGYESFQDSLLRQVERSGLGEHVVFHGFAPDVWPFVAATDVVVVPSTIDEPFGNTAVEAILGGRPLVVSAISGLTEAVDGFDAAVPVAANQPEALADGLEQVVLNWAAYSAKAMADAGTAASRFSAERYARQLLSVVGAVLGALPVESADKHTL
jgi:glycosyltransferase involved in cell wall biosynthesis